MAESENIRQVKSGEKDLERNPDMRGSIPEILPPIMATPKSLFINDFPYLWATVASNDRSIIIP